MLDALQLSSQYNVSTPVPGRPWRSAEHQEANDDSLDHRIA